MQDDRRNLPLKSLASIIAGGRRSEHRADSILRKKRARRSKLLRNS